MILMKKAYVKVKTPSAKTILKRPYIAATIIGAAVCAIILSLTISPVENENVQEESLSSVSEQAETIPEPTVIPPIEFPETSHESETELPNEPEIRAVEPTEEEINEEAVSVGLFGNGGKIAMTKPCENEIIKDYSGTKPVKSKTMGDWRVHSGIDIKAESGAVVKAPADGEVVRAEKDSLTGYTVSIDHGNGVISTVYNLAEEDLATLGQKVNKGDAIGKAGNSAAVELLDDPHIHFEVKKDGAFVDPKEYFN